MLSALRERLRARSPDTHADTADRSDHPVTSETAQEFAAIQRLAASIKRRAPADASQYDHAEEIRSLAFHQRIRYQTQADDTTATPTGAGDPVVERSPRLAICDSCERVYSTLVNDDCPACRGDRA